MGPSTPQKSTPSLNRKNLPAQNRFPVKWQDTVAGFEQEFLRKQRSEETIKAYRIQINKFGIFTAISSTKPDPI